MAMSTTAALRSTRSGSATRAPQTSHSDSLSESWIFFVVQFDADDADFVAADRRRAPGYFAARDSVSSQTGRDERRLAVVHMYTDDPIFVVVASARAVRVLRTWRRVTRLINLTMAIAAKHQGGVAAVWLGLLQLSQLGALAIPLPKHSDAIAEVRALLRGDIFQKDRYQSILGLLEHSSRLRQWRPQCNGVHARADQGAAERGADGPSSYL